MIVSWFNILPSALLVLLINITNCQRYEFDVCKKGENDEPDHVCRKAIDCKSALEGVKKFNFPKICGYDDQMPIVCCAPAIDTDNGVKVDDDQAITEKHNIKTSEMEHSEAVSIVNKMCDEYKSLQYELRRSGGELLGEKIMYTKTPKCSQAQELIVGGIEAKSQEFPHMALLGTNPATTTSWSCGGSLISDQFVLTAAHCVDSKNLNGQQKFVRLGELNYAGTDDDAKPMTIPIESITIHPEYNPDLSYDDIALIKLRRRVPFSTYIRPFCLDTSPVIDDKTATATGWGQTGTLDDRSSVLRKVNISIIDEVTCDTAWVGVANVINGINPQKMLCAGDEGLDTCLGDSGGPIQIKDTNEPCMYTQIGITSLGKLICGEKNSPAIYTRVSHYIPWIQKIVWPKKTI